MSLKALATSTCSVEPVGVARVCRSPAAIWRAVRARPRSGRDSEPAMAHARPSPSASTAAPRASRATTSRRTSSLTALTLWVRRTAPAARPASTIGTAV